MTERRYRQLADMLEFGSLHRMSCHYQTRMILGSCGEVFYCKDSRERGNVRQRLLADIYYDRENRCYRHDERLRGKCRHCQPNTFNRLEAEKDILKYLGYRVASKFSHPASEDNKPA
jgi:hypothetical protein